MKKKIPHTWPYPRHPQGPRDPLFRGNRYFERHIYIYRSQVLLDIEQEVAIVAKTRKNMDGSDDDTLNNIAEKYRPLFNRWIDKYLNLAKNRMAAFILDPFRKSKGNNLKEDEEIDIELQVPDYWDDTTFQPLCQAVHDYIVNGAMYEFMSLTLPPRERVVNVKQIDVEQSYADIKRYICSVKPGWIRKPLQPF